MGQDPHAGSMEQMKIWYNPALKTDKESYAKAVFRSIKYPEILSYSTKTATVELVFIGADEDNNDNLPYFSLSAGINVDNASNNLLSASTAMLSLSYALPLNYNNTYIAIGVQSNYSFNKVGSTDYTPDFPEKFDKFGAIGWALSRDPYATGYNYSYFTIGAGTTVFHSDKNSYWYIGASARNINHPYTEWSRSSALPTTYGIQGGIGQSISESAQIGVFCNISRSSVTEQHYTISYTRHFGLTDSTGIKVMGSLGISPGESMKPLIGLTFGKDQFGFGYEFNLPGIASGGFNRRGFNLTYRRKL